MTIFKDLEGLTLTKVELVGTEEIVFETAEGRTFLMNHEQDCCETVEVEDVCGDLDDLIGTPVRKAEKTTNEKDSGPDGSETWTFYHLRTIKGTVTIRWYGESNGYYSESVDFEEVK